MPFTEYDDADEYETQTKIRTVDAKRNGDGGLRRVEVHIDYWRSREHDDGSIENRRRMEAKAEYYVEDATATLIRLLDTNTPGLSEDDHNPGIAPLLLRVLPYTEAAVGNVPGVEHVERAEETFGRHLAFERED